MDDLGTARKVKIGTSLSPEVRKAIVACLRRNRGVFAWSHSDMKGVDPDLMCHRLNIDPRLPAHRQKRRPLNPERAQALKDEVDRLIGAGFIREAKYPDWVSNPVLVPKPDGRWRCCVDFTNLNEACPKDSFPVPRIDQMVDATAGHELLSFMDAYSGYNQIPMYHRDEEHTAFIIDRGLYCYKVMPFGLKNAGATYQRLVNKIFADLLGVSMEVYIDDMLVKSTKAQDHVEHLDQTFSVLRKTNMMLNPNKCTFAVRAGKFLGFMVSQRGIEANLEKIQAIVDMRPPRRGKEV